MSSVNKVILIGNLGKDPEVRFTSGGQAVCQFSIATSEKWKNKTTNEWEERTEWHNIVVWGKQAELCKEYLAKGRTVYIEGRLQTRSWDDKEGKKRYTTEIVATTVRFLGGRKEGSAGAGSYSKGGSAQDSAPQAAMSSNDGPPDFDADEDIPF